MRRIEKTLQDYVAGDLDEASARAVERLIESDARVRALHEEIREAHEALSALRERPAPPVGADEVLPLIRSAIAADPFAPRPRLELEGQGTRYYRRLALAASVLFALTAGLLVATGAFRSESAVPAAIGTDPARDAAERGLMLYSEPASEFFERLEREGRRPEDLPREIPILDVLPISDPAVGK